jgi:hypothetical protein
VLEHNIVELKENHIPRGLVPLKRLFENNDVSRKYVIIKSRRSWNAILGQLQIPK